MSFDARRYLEHIGQKNDQEIALAETALALAYPNHSGISFDRYTNHIKQMIAEVADRFSALLEGGADDDVMTRLAALKHVLADKHEYCGDEDQYNDLENADLMRVIDRRKGMPIALCILYMDVGRAQGWAVDGLNMPGHFVVRLEMGGERVIFDPFERAKVLEAPDLRAQIKKSMGPQAELKAEFFNGASNRETLIRLQNNIKSRLIDAENYEGALEVIEVMRLIDPNEFRLLLDAGVLYSKTQKPVAAIRALETYIEKAPNPKDRDDARLVLNHVRSQL